jgi:hypothetical protein
MDVIERIENWFSVAIPSPTPYAWQPQLAVHIEEFTEMLVDGLGFDPDGDTAQELAHLQRYYKSKNDLNEPNDLMFLDSLADQIVTAVGIAKMRGYDIFGALKEVAQSNESKYYYAGVGDLSDHEWGDLNTICKEIESQGRYKGVGWERHGEWIVFKDENNKILKNPRTYREPELASFVGGK